MSYDPEDLPPTDGDPMFLVGLVFWAVVITIFIVSRS